MRQAVVLGLIVVWMLVADDALDLVGTVVLERRPARQVRDRDRPAKPGFAAELLRRHQLVRAVESAGHDLDLGTIDTAETERRAAVGTEVALGNRGRAERGRHSTGPGESAMVDFGKGREWRAGCLLTHPAMTNADPCRRSRERKAKGAALAAAGQNGLCRRSHAHSASR